MSRIINTHTYKYKQSNSRTPLQIHIQTQIYRIIYLYEYTYIWHLHMYICTFKHSSKPPTLWTGALDLPPPTHLLLRKSPLFVCLPSRLSATRSVVPLCLPHCFTCQWLLWNACEKIFHFLLFWHIFLLTFLHSKYCLVIASLLLLLSVFNIVCYVVFYIAPFFIHFFCE